MDRTPAAVTPGYLESEARLEKDEFIYQRLKDVIFSTRVGITGDQLEKILTVVVKALRENALSGETEVRNHQPQEEVALRLTQTARDILKEEAARL